MIKFEGSYITFSKKMLLAVRADLQQHGNESYLVIWYQFTHILYP